MEDFTLYYIDRDDKTVRRARTTLHGILLDNYVAIDEQDIGKRLFATDPETNPLLLKVDGEWRRKTGLLHAPVERLDTPTRVDA